MTVPVHLVEQAQVISGLISERKALADALQAAVIGLEAAIAIHAAVEMDTEEDSRIQAEAIAAMQLARDHAREALAATETGK